MNTWAANRIRSDPIQTWKDVGRSMNRGTGSGARGGSGWSRSSAGEIAIDTNRGLGFMDAGLSSRASEQLRSAARGLGSEGGVSSNRISRGSLSMHVAASDGEMRNDGARGGIGRESEERGSEVKSLASHDIGEEREGNGKAEREEEQKPPVDTCPCMYGQCRVARPILPAKTAGERMCEEFWGHGYVDRWDLLGCPPQGVYDSETQKLQDYESGEDDGGAVVVAALGVAEIEGVRGGSKRGERGKGGRKELSVNEASGSQIARVFVDDSSTVGRETDGWLRCFRSAALHSSICEGHLVGVYPSKIEMDRGGEDISHVLGRDEERELPRCAPGAIEVLSRGEKGGERGLKHWEVRRGEGGGGGERRLEALAGSDPLSPCPPR